MTVLTPFYWQINNIVADDCAKTGSLLACMDTRARARTHANTNTCTHRSECGSLSPSVTVEDIRLIKSVWLSE